MFFIPFFTLFCTEILKVIIQSIKQKEFSIAWFLHSGGMPSGHSSFTSSVATLTAYVKGYDSIEFLIALSLAIVVMYDARGLRAQVGKHAESINKLSSSKKTHDIYAGHTNLEVIIGASFGIIFTIVFIFLLK